MDKIAQFTASERQEIFAEAAAQLSVIPAIVEKDFWVSWTLGKLFSHSSLKDQLMFKGGTSLSKIYQVIERFSEDIDLILNWQNLTANDPMLEASKTKDDKTAKELNQQAQIFIAQTLLPQIAQLLSPLCQCQLDNSDPYVINVTYPASFPDAYLRPEIRLEIGPMAAWTPHENKPITCMTTSVFPHLLTHALPSVNVISAQRTFWEKATILHAEAFRSEGKPQPPRYSRHYYDLYRLMNTEIKKLALEDHALLAQVVTFKRRFYQCSHCHYELAQVGTFKLIPPDSVLTMVRKDYQAMREMIYGNYPSFDEIITSLAELEHQINGTTS